MKMAVKVFVHDRPGTKKFHAQSSEALAVQICHLRGGGGRQNQRTRGGRNLTVPIADRAVMKVAIYPVHRVRDRSGERVSLETQTYTKVIACVLLP
jgi:hypothetical protein